MKKILIVVLFFYFLTLLQTSFLVHFDNFLINLNFIFIIAILINLIEKPKNNFGVFGALLAGFFLDIFSERPFGFYALILILLTFIIKLVVKKYVRIPFIKRV